MKLVKIGRQGRVIKEYAMNDGASLNDLLKSSNESIGPDDQLEINGNLAPLDRCDMLGNIRNNTVVLIVNVPRIEKINVKLGRVGERLVSVTILPGNSAFRILSNNSFDRNLNEKLYLKKVSDSHYDRDITSEEANYIPVDGDILIIEKIRVVDPRFNSYLHFINWLETTDCMEIQVEHEELEEAIKDYLNQNKI